VWRFLYRVAWTLARPLAAVLALAHRAASGSGRGAGKLARSLAGRRNAVPVIRAWASRHRVTARPLVWFHAASVGEGRQAEAVIVRLRAARPAWQLAYTFASSSAERLAGALPVDFAGYVPMDLPGDCGAALDLLTPAALVFSATDVWPELVRQADRRGVPVALISATLAPTSSRRGAAARALLGEAYAALARVGAIADADARAIEALGARAERVTVTGDTRHDAAAARAAAVNRNSPALRAIRADGPTPVIVAGSTWPDDERALLPALTEVRRRTPLRLVIAPHEPTPAYLAALERRIANALGEVSVRRLSALETGLAEPGASRDAGPEGAVNRQQSTVNWSVCVVDRVGVLAELYAAARVAFVGGGFHAAGLHAVIEPAALGVPLVFGPRWRSSRDAGLLLEAGAAAAAPDATALAGIIAEWLTNESARAAAGAAARAVVERGLGAAERSLGLVLELVEARGSKLKA
jgi:3-deoxy-D-manno-octulosonic-acid transferase